MNLVPQREEGAGNAGCLLHPRSRVSVKGLRGWLQSRACVKDIEDRANKIKG